MTTYGIENIRFLFPWDDEPTPPDPGPDPPPDLEFLFTTQTPTATGLTDGPYTLGTVLTVDVDGQVVGVRAYFATLPTSSPHGLLYQWSSNTAGTLLADKAFADLVIGWNTILFDTPIDVVAGQRYVAAWGPANPYGASNGFFDTGGPGAAGLVNGHITAIPNAGGITNGNFHAGATITYPDGSFQGSCYFVDFLFKSGPYLEIAPRTPRITQASAQGAGAPFTALRPTDQAAGDLVVAWFGFSDSTANSTGPGGGWVEVPNSRVVPPAGGRNAVAYYQFDPSSDPVVSQAAAGRITAVLEAYGNVDPANPLDVAAVAATASGTPLAIGSVSPVTPGARVISAAIIDAATGTWTIPAQQTLVGSNTSGVGRGLAVAHERFPTPGATGTRTFVFSAGSLSMAGASMVLRPAPNPDYVP